MISLKILIVIMLIFFALGLACAVWLASWRGPGIDRRRELSILAPVDPYHWPIGDVPGFSREQLAHFARRSNIQMRHDPLGRALDFSSSAELAPLRTKAGGHHHPSMSAGPSYLSNALFMASIAIFGPIGVVILGAWLLVCGQ